MKTVVFGWTGFKHYERNDPSEECNSVRLNVCPCSRRRKCEKYQECSELEPYGSKEEDALIVKLGIKKKADVFGDYDLSVDQRIKGDKLVAAYLLAGLKRCKPVKITVESRKGKK